MDPASPDDRELLALSSAFWRAWTRSHRRWIRTPSQRVRRAQDRPSSTSARTPYLDQSQRCVGWIDAATREPLLIFEIGAGFNTPGVVRYPLERLAAQHVNARFVRINREYPSVPAALTDRAIGIAGDAGDVIGAIWKAWSGRSRTRKT